MAGGGRVIGGESELERLVARSRLIGGDPALVVHGGGNTSTKAVEDGRRVLRIKGSGTDLATIGADGFPGLFLDELLPLRSRSAMSDEEMVAYLEGCMVDRGARAPSIETLLHGFLPATHVDHVHADAICALTNHPDGRRAVASTLGDDVAYVPYIRPGFELSRRVAALSEARAVVLEHHGLVTWGASGEESYELTVALASAAGGVVELRSAAPVRDLARDEVERLLPALRETLGEPVLHVDRDQRELADRDDVALVATLARATPDHMLRIGPRSAVVREAGAVGAVIDAFSRAYRAYFDRHAHPDTRMRSALPSVVLVPGLGCVAAGRTVAEARMRADIAYHSHLVAAMVLDTFGRVHWLSEADVFAFEYWPLELRKLR